jgi:ComF family protein
MNGTVRWLDFLFPPRADETVLRDISDDDFLALTAPRLVPDTRPGTVALFPFGDERVRSAIHEAKYHGSKHAFRLLGSALSEYLRDCDDVGRSTSYIVPVPLGKERMKERGFNQVEEVVRYAISRLDNRFIINTNLLERIKETKTQVSLERQRREENMRGAFKAAHRADPACTYIVIDDVITTGATLQAAINALKEVGAKHIIPLALAH